jgi:hypothetical protein
MHWRHTPIRAARLTAITLLPLASLIACSGDGGQTDASASANAGGGSASSTSSGGGDGGGGGGGEVCEPGSTSLCYTGPAGTSTSGLCKTGQTICKDDGSGYGACEGEVLPIPESCATLGDDDCNGQVNEGCACVPGTTAACYTGPIATKDIGACHEGTQTCNADGTGYGACIGEVTPALETCMTPADDDCDGVINEEGAGCVCTPSSTASCYSGPPGSNGIGLCVGGTTTCNDQGTAYGACVGEITPVAETCNTVGDDDCDGSVNEDGVGCVCTPSSVTACYTGPMGSQNVGACIGGQKACDAQGTAYGPCIGEVTPTAETCNTAVDDDCDGSINEEGVGCVCLPNSAASCYSGPPGTENVGICKAGTKTCNAQGTAYGACAGEVTPTLENCNTPADENCNGMVDVCNSLVWAKQAGDMLDQDGLDIAVDTAGNVYATGSFEGVIDLGGGPLTSAGADDLFIVKYTAAGAHAFSKRIGGISFEDPSSISVDAAGNIYVTGAFTGVVDFGGGALTSAGLRDIFVLKLSSAGNHIWSRRFGGVGNDDGIAVAVDALGNVFVVGEYEANIDFGGGTLLHNGANDIYLLKLSSMGTHIFSKGFGDFADQLSRDMVIDGLGNVLITGHLSSTIDFGGGALVSAGAQDVFAVKFTTSGNHVWSRRFGASAGQIGDGIGVDQNNNVILTGYFQTSIDLGGGPHASLGGNDLFAAKFDPSGVYVWSKSYGGFNEQILADTSVNANGIIVLTGRNSGTVDFGGGAVVSAGGNDGFVAMLDPVGGFVWNKGFGDGVDQFGRGVALDGAGAIAFIGTFAGTIDIGGGPITSTGGLDVLIAKLSP